MDVYLLTGASDAGHGGVIRELERAGNTVTVVRIPITEMN
jgi:predicted ATPase